MKVSIVGLGAVGGVLAGGLIDAGHEVCALARGATLAHVHTCGLGVEDDSGRRYLPLRASADPAELGPQDLVILSVKQPALPAIAPAIGPLLGPDTRVLTAINGVPWWFPAGMPAPLADMSLDTVDPGGVLARTIPNERVIGCVVHMACYCPEPGVALRAMGRRLIVGDVLGGVGPHTEAVASALEAGGFEVERAGRIQREVWFKLWGNMTMNPISALTGATSDRILDDPLVRRFCERIMEEAARIGARIGCGVDQTPAQRNDITRKLGAMRTSMLQDVDAGRVLEIDALLGAVLEIADGLDEAAPETAALYGLVRLFAEVQGLR